jgi:hypothetical protein
MRKVIDVFGSAGEVNKLARLVNFSVAAKAFF